MLVSNSIIYGIIDRTELIATMKEKKDYVCQKKDGGIKKVSEADIV